MDTKYFATATVTAWAIPRPNYALDTDPEFTIKVMMGDNKPYNDGAFKVSTRDLEWEVTIPENDIEAQIESLVEAREEEYRQHARRLQEIADKINDLSALPAPK